MMFVFVIDNSYQNNQAMQNNMQGLNVVCKYYGYEKE